MIINCEIYDPDLITPGPYGRGQILKKISFLPQTHVFMASGPEVHPLLRGQYGPISYKIFLSPPIYI